MTIALIDEATADGAGEGGHEAHRHHTSHAHALARAGRRRDKRREAASPPAHKLTTEEHREHPGHGPQPEFATFSPIRQIVPLLADQNKYIGSESTFYRVCAGRGPAVSAHRGHARPRKSRKPEGTLRLRPQPGSWSWDITYPGSRQGNVLYLYMIVDVYSRKIVGWQVEQEESTTHSSALISDATRAEQVDPTARPAR
ncbi:MAG: hypothetical protein KIT72_16700 [Polyangiaceae bacterium]|nr:hypothetical protein [Polyangiaceae bacterium]